MDHNIQGIGKSWVWIGTEIKDSEMTEEWRHLLESYIMQDPIFLETDIAYIKKTAWSHEKIFKEEV